MQDYNNKSNTKGADSFEQYIKDLSLYPLLSAEEEAEVVKSIKKGDQVALDKLIKSNLRYVVKVASGYLHTGADLKELISEGNLGLIYAAKKFDGSSGHRFITYATYWIQKYILASLVQKHDAVHVPLNKAESLQKVKRASAEFEQKHDRTPRPHELAEELRMKEEDVLFLLSLAQHSKHLDEGINNKEDDDDGKLTFKDVYQGDGAIEADDKLNRESLSDDISEALKILNDREQQVLVNLYGIGTDKKTQKELAVTLGVSLSRLWQIKERALHKLKVAGYDSDLTTY